MMYFSKTLENTECHQADDKTELIQQLKQHGDAVIVLDYTLFDINQSAFQYLDEGIAYSGNS